MYKPLKLCHFISNLLTDIMICIFCSFLQLPETKHRWRSKLETNAVNLVRPLYSVNRNTLRLRIHRCEHKPHALLLCYPENQATEYIPRCFCENSFLFLATRKYFVWKKGIYNWRWQEKKELTRLAVKDGADCPRFEFLIFNRLLCSTDEPVKI